MRIIILGAGAIGSLYGAKLSKLNDMLLVGNKNHIGAIIKNGLEFSGIENGKYKLRAAEKIEKSDIKKNTLIVLSTKVYDSKKSIMRIKKFLRKDTIILCLQNGLGSEEMARKAADGKCAVLRAVTSFGAAFLKPGHVEYNSKGATYIQKSPKSRAIAENFTKCGLNCKAHSSIKLKVWEKLVINCIVNPLTAILGVKNEGIADRKLDGLKKAIAEECVKAAEKEGVKLKGDFVKSVNIMVKGSKNKSSMLQDILKGKKTEIMQMNGAVAELGKKHGIKCQVNENITQIIQWMEKECKKSY